MKRILASGLLLIFPVLASDARAGGFPSFADPILLTDGSEHFQMSRNPNGSLQFDATGRLHFTYWSGQQQTTPQFPSRVYHQSWAPLAGWSPRTAIDSSEVDGEHFGGRQPSMAITSDNTVWIVWHDHRHCTADGGYIDNIEIYADRLPPGGTFSNTDIRLTETNVPASSGDNGYVPRIVTMPDDSLAVMWYDFNDDPNVSDIYLQISDVAGDFPGGDVAPYRLTRRQDRSNTPSYSVGDLAVDSTGNLFGIWAAEFEEPASLFFAELPQPATIVSEELFSTGTGAYFDPAKLVVAPNDDLWAIYTTKEGTQSRVALQRRPAAASTFESSIIPSPGVNQSSPCGAFDSDGMLHLVWIDQRNGRHVYHGVFDPHTESLVHESPVTTVAGNWRQPVIALDQEDRPVVAFGESTGALTGDIWFAGPPPTSTGSLWTIYP